MRIEKIMGNFIMECLFFQGSESDRKIGLLTWVLIVNILILTAIA